MTELIINNIKKIVDVENRLSELLGEEVIKDKHVDWISEDIQKHKELFESLSALDVVTLASMAPRIDAALPHILGTYPSELRDKLSDILVKAVHAALNF